MRWMTRKGKFDLLGFTSIMDQTWSAGDVHF